MNDAAGRAVGRRHSGDGIGWEDLPTGRAGDAHVTLVFYPGTTPPGETANSPPCAMR
jgi:hypothetical protein